jgi:hypothetical protein
MFSYNINLLGWGIKDKKQRKKSSRQDLSLEYFTSKGVNYKLFLFTLTVQITNE